MVDKCFYCKKNESSPEHAYTHKMYFVHNRMKLWVGYRYSERKINIPRCKECYNKHTNFGKPLFWGLFLLSLGFAIWVMFIRSDDSEASLFSRIFGTIILFLFMFTPVWCGVEYFFFSKCMGIPREEEFDEFPLAEQMIKNGWIKSRPDPASFPNSGYENIAENIAKKHEGTEQKQ